MSATVARPVSVRPLGSAHLEGRKPFQNEIFSQDSFHVVHRSLAIMAELDPVDGTDGLSDDADPHTFINSSNIVSIGGCRRINARHKENVCRDNSVY